MTERMVNIGVVGTGFIARGLAHSINRSPSHELSSVLTRRDIQTVGDLPVNEKVITNYADELIKKSQIVIECTGDPVYGTNVLVRVMRSSLPVVTMDSELQITTGSWLKRKGYITEAVGDQPGSLAALSRDAVAMGFSPVVYGNIKGFLNLAPSRKDMRYWAKRNGVRLDKVTAFTDGTKVQIEQALVANGLGADISKRGLVGVKADKFEDGAMELAEISRKFSKPISDYVLAPGSPAGVFIVATHLEEQASFLRYLKMGNGPFYLLTRPYHLIHLEILKTVDSVLRGEKPLLDNSVVPEISVAAVAKRDILPGEQIPHGIGSFIVRGEAVRITEDPDHVPIGLVSKVIVKEKIEKGQTINFENVNIPDSLALKAWKETANQT